MSLKDIAFVVEIEECGDGYWMCFACFAGASNVIEENIVGMF